jgi:hypothetical protein
MVCALAVWATKLTDSDSIATRSVIDPAFGLFMRAAYRGAEKPSNRGDLVVACRAGVWQTSGMAGTFQARELQDAQTLLVGREQHPVIVIDDFLIDTEPLMHYASTAVRFAAPKNWYPGLRAEPLPQPYVIEVIRALHIIIGKTFDLPMQGGVDANTYFGLATLTPDALSTLQRLPHFDSTNPRQIATLHYLCDASHGGTSFFRHRSTGYESVGLTREPEYFGTLNREVASSRTRPPRYASGDDDLFEEIGRIEAKFNRLIVYRSLVLHSANVDFVQGLNPDPRKGRLTANVFLAYK